METSMKNSRRPFDPLSFIPSSAVVRQRLDETRDQVRKLEILLDVATRLDSPGADSGQHSDAETAHPSREVARGD
jgi:hypothetical protein